MTQPLIVVKPVTITDAMLITTDVTEADYSAWSSVTTYALGDRVILTSTHKIYESAAGSNLNHDPATSDQWTEVSPTNRWKLFDTSNSTQTAKSTGMSYQLRPGVSINSVDALNTVGVLTMRVRSVHPSLGSIYDETQDLASLPDGPGWWEWYYGARTEPSLAVFNDLPAIPSCDIYVDFTGTTALAVGVLILGEQRPIGMGIKAGARVGFTDYSRKETNDFGDTVFVVRAVADRANFDFPVEASQVDAVRAYFRSIRATPCLFIGSTVYESTVVFGWVDDFEAVISYATFSECSLSVKGLT